MRVLGPNEKTIDVARDASDRLRREEWSFHEDGSVRSYSKAHRDSVDDEWTWTLLTFSDSPGLFGWKDPPRDVIHEALAQVSR